MQGNFNVIGSNVPKQIYDKYNNVQIITDGSQRTKQAMWWKNKVNVTKPFTIKFYAYITAPDLSNVADGITFSLQNDDRKQITDSNGNPIKSNAIGTNGESMGAYGDVRSNNYYDGDYIKNDFSYEFDPYYNGDYSDNGLQDKFGNSITGQHTAFTTTDSTGINGLTRGSLYGNYGFSQNHYDAHPLSDWPGILLPKWHKFIYNWTPNSDGTAKADVQIDDSSIHQSHVIDINQILGANNNNPYVWWGFTGSTGLYTMISAIADTAVTGDPGITKLALDISNLSDDKKKQIKYNIDNSNQSELTKKELIDCIYNPNSSSSDADLSNMLVSLVPSEYFSASVKNTNVGDVILYKVSIYNYKTIDGIGNDWTNVKVVDDNLSDKGMTSLDNRNNIDATYEDIPPIDINSNSDVQPSSVGIRTIINSNKNISNPRSNIVVASGSNFYGNSIEGNNASRSSVANVYVNKTLPPINNRILVDNKMTNVNKNDSLKSDNLSDVSSYNSIKYSTNLKNIVDGSKTSNSGTYSFWVPSLNGNQADISVNNKQISSNATNSSPYYKISDNYEYSNSIGNYLNKNSNDSKRKLVTIYNLPSISVNNDVNITATIKLDNKNPTSFSSTPTFMDGSDYYIGQKENYNFDNGNLSFNYINDIDYGIKDSFYINTLLSPSKIERQNNYYSVNKNKVYNMAQIYDSRRYKIPYSVYLSQIPISNNSVNEIGSKESPFILHYFKNNNDNILNPNSEPIDIFNNNITNDDDNDTVSNINWDNQNELKLGNNTNFNEHNYSIQKGTTSYNAELNWSIKDNGTP
ncbi:hypothetical protein DY120_00645 [Apilactobacillus micheneri]|uniref:Uncharacterized protein n=1 Tax=Apilactobacillus micheneri TaxID=1899430 RepID=A0ABY2YY57_9LACO|nr:hypothetical protein [Apilactobacillus micheneri]TPR26238.1 hypothetical protein DY114_00645 [Apilactobacillus micheneri]TPR26992.1 hypothetical protein DY111_00645 [Apilactobacillus micheneri]TPR27850.1 hypothetical protein DY113_04420 [Apilactobacillus micheneri]TPR31755.1 hypothetical protein DY117_00645 [Apilactobacillus micheneri]TPR32159.1 hypothetical protein DY120_00645 [Apilactobacillus micheneri]